MIAESGGESYFNTVLPAFGQPQSFFWLVNQNWRIIGLDTAYAGGQAKRANIFLTHISPCPRTAPNGMALRRSETGSTSCSR